jgi:DNA-binding response OmpR family regulator
MLQQKQKVRLDRLLLQNGLITASQLNEALLRQKMQGGRLGSQLMYLRYIDEVNLVKVLSQQFECDGVVLSQIAIPDSIIKLIPAKLACSRRIMPFEYDSAGNILKIACIDPTNTALINEIGFVAQGKRLKLFVAAELALDTAIAKYYLGREINLNQNLLLEIPDILFEAERSPIAMEQKIDAGHKRLEDSVLIITDEEFSGSLIQSIIERDGFDVTLCDSMDKAKMAMAERRFNKIFIKELIEGASGNFIEGIRKLLPGSSIRRFDKASSLVLNDDIFSTIEKSAKLNLELFSLLLSAHDNLLTNHSAAVGRYADELCVRLGLSPMDKLSITTAGYLHDVAKYYYKNIEAADQRSIIELSGKLLESLDYSKEVIHVLNSMYKNIDDKVATELPFEILGASILTVVDLFCDSISFNERLTLDRFHAIKKKLRDFSGKLFLSEVVEAFIGMIQEEILSPPRSGFGGQILIFSKNREESYPLELRLKNEGFNCLWDGSIEGFMELYLRRKPDVVLLFLQGDVDVLLKELREFATRGLDYKNMPAFLMAGIPSKSKLTPLFEQGIEDIIAVDGNYEMLIVKLRKIFSKSKIGTKSENVPEEKATGTQGRLSDMNLIDLIQAMSPGKKTAKITLNNVAGNENLEIYIGKGDVIFARLGALTGADAIYEGITWSEGNWTIEAISPDTLPQSNNKLSNDAILLEGVYRLDERIRSGKL